MVGVSIGLRRLRTPPVYRAQQGADAAVVSRLVESERAPAHEIRLAGARARTVLRVELEPRVLEVDHDEARGPARQMLETSLQCRARPQAPVTSLSGSC